MLEICFVGILTLHSGRTLEETAALFDGEEKHQDLVALGGEAANTTMGTSRSIILSGSESTKQEIEDKKDRYYELKRRKADLDCGVSNTDLVSRIL